MDIKEELRKYEKKDCIKEKFEYFHKTGKGGYAEKDIFLGITVPDIRKVAEKYYKEINIIEVKELLHSEYHEERLLALIIFNYKMKKADKSEKEEIIKVYINNTQYINGWDLVDMSAPHTLGKYLLENPDKIEILYDFAKSNNLWKQRIAIVTTWIFIRNNKYDNTLKIAKILINNKEDLIHKATGWMLREVGKRDFDLEYKYLIGNYKVMPRTMLRYAIEKFEEPLRISFLKGEI